MSENKEKAPSAEDLANLHIYKTDSEIFQNLLNKLTAQKYFIRLQLHHLEKDERTIKEKIWHFFNRKEYWYYMAQRNMLIWLIENVPDLETAFEFHKARELKRMNMI